MHAHTIRGDLEEPLLDAPVLVQLLQRQLCVFQIHEHSTVAVDADVEVPQVLEELRVGKYTSVRSQMP
jgi:hypothetical protein